VLVCRSNPVAPDPRVEKIAQTLAQAGYPVRILGWDRSAALPILDQIGDISLTRLPIRAEYARGVGNFPALLRWQWGLLGWLVRHRRDYDLIHACDFDTVLPALLCRSMFGKRVIYDIFDFYADHLRATPTRLKRLIRALDLRLIGWADALILVDDARWTQIEGAHPRRSAVIYNSPADVYPALQAADWQSDVPPPSGSRLRLAYIGLLQMERGLFELLAVLQKHPEWSLDLAGFGGDEAAIQEKCAALPNVRWLGRVPYDRALQLSYAADALIATYDPAIPNHRYSSPNKVFEAMMLGKPIIVADQTNMDSTISSAECGLVVPYGDVPALEAALARLANDPALRRRLGENARCAYEASYSWPIMQSRLLALYAAVIGGGSPTPL
jgi:glycosyltransferase involved in cell wall biosynthesis